MAHGAWRMAKPRDFSLPMSRRTFWIWLACAAVVSAALRIPYVASLGYPVRGDEAVNAIMARRIFRGQDAPLFLYGVDYLSSLEGWAAAAAWRVAGEDGMVSFRILPLLSSVAAVPLLGLLVARLFGRLPGALAAMLIAVPPSYFLHVTSVAIGGYAEGFLMGILLWHAFLSIRRRERREEPVPARPYLRFALATAAAWWIYPMVLPLLVPMALVWARHPEGPGSARLPWRQVLLPHRGAEGALRKGLAVLSLWNALAAGILVWVLATGGGELRLGSLRIGLSNGAKVAFWVVLLTGAGVAILCVRRRVLPVTRGLAALAAGVVLAKSVWGLQCLLGRWEDPVHLRFRLAQGGDWMEHLRRLWTEIVPELLGISAGLTWLERTAWAAGGLLALGLLRAPIARRYLRGIAGVFRLAPAGSELRSAFLAILAIVPLLNLIRGGPEMPVRYWAYWHLPLAAALSLGFAWAFRHPGRKAVWIGVLAALAVGACGWETVRDAAARTPFDTRKPDAAIARLSALGVGGGHAEYDLAHAITFLSRERLGVLPFDYRNRIPGLPERVRALPRRAYLFHADPASKDRARAAELRAHLRSRGIPFRTESVAGLDIVVYAGPPAPLTWHR